tara:strand:- start:1304 stop:2011 length:708 start_codon:yes stop_codon:yes gene_type:complete
MELNIITGVSNGLGKELYESLSKKNKCLGITSKNTQLNQNIFYLSLTSLDYKIEYFKKIINRINQRNYDKIIFYLNSAIYDSNQDTLEDKLTILKINFFNQIEFVNRVKKLTNIKKIKLIFFSSFEIYNYNSSYNYYKISKALYLEEYLRNIYKDPNEIYKIFILGGIKTERYIINTKNKKYNFIRKMIVAEKNKACNYIIKKSKTDFNEIIYYPKIYFYLNKIKLIKQLFFLSK